MFDVAKVRKDFPILEEQVILAFPAPYKDLINFEYCDIPSFTDRKSVV